MDFGNEPPAARLEHKTPSAEKPPAEKPPAPKAGSAAASPVKALIKRAIPGWRSKPGAWGCLLSVGIGLRLLVSIKVSSEIGVLGSLLAQRKWDAQRLLASYEQLHQPGNEGQIGPVNRKLIAECGGKRTDRPLRRPAPG